MRRTSPLSLDPPSCGPQTWTPSQPSMTSGTRDRWWRCSSKTKMCSSERIPGLLWNRTIRTHQALFMWTFDRLVFFSSVDTFCRWKNVPRGLARSNFCPVFGADSELISPFLSGDFRKGSDQHALCEVFVSCVVVTQHVLISCSTVIFFFCFPVLVIVHILSCLLHMSFYLWNCTKATDFFFFADFYDSEWFFFYLFGSFSVTWNS